MSNMRTSLQQTDVRIQVSMSPVGKGGLPPPRSGAIQPERGQAPFPTAGLPKLNPPRKVERIARSPEKKDRAISRTDRRI